MATLDLSPVHPETVAEPVRSTLAGLRKKYGFLPNLYRVFAHAPAALNGYNALAERYHADSTLNATERNLVLLAAARENECKYCVAVHSTVADMQKDAGDVTDAIRDDRPIADPKLEALRLLTQVLVRQRGHANAEVKRFLEVGYRPEQVMDVLTGIALKTLSNYVNHVAETPLDDAFKARAWTP